MRCQKCHAAQEASPRLAPVEQEEVSSAPADALTPGPPASAQPATAARGLFPSQAPQTAVPDVASATAQEADGDDAPYESFEIGQGPAGEVDASSAAASGADTWQHDDSGWGDPEVDVVQPAESQGSVPARVLSEAAANHAAAEDAAGGDAAAYDTAGGDAAADVAEERPKIPSSDAEAEADAEAADGWDADGGGWDDVDGESASGDGAAGAPWRR